MKLPLKVLGAAIFIGLPLYALGTCVYWAVKPHLFSNTFASVLMNAPRMVDFNPRTIEVNFIPDQLAAGASPFSVNTALQLSGFQLEFDIDNPGPYTDPDYIASERARGVSKTYSMGGRISFPCGEVFFVEVGFSEVGLTKAVGYAIWTCM